MFVEKCYFLSIERLLVYLIGNNAAEGENYIKYMLKVT